MVNTMQKNILNIKELFYKYDKDGEVIFDDFNFTMKYGEVVTLLGESGVGKTTLIRLISGCEVPCSGTIEIYGETVSTAGNNIISPEKRNVSVMFQEFALFPHLTARQNVAFSLIHTPKKEVDEIVDDTLRIVKMMDYADKYPYELSGGQQQRISFARAIAPRPQIILMDEPFSHLDSNLSASLRDEILHIIKSIGCSVIIITHSAEEAMFMSDKIVLLGDGGIIQEGAPKDLYFHPKNTFVSNFFGEVNIIPAVIKNKKAITGIGTFDTDLPDSDSADVVIRYESVKLIPVENSGNVITDIKNLGMMDLLHLDCANNTHLHCRVDNMHTYDIGQCVDIQFNNKLIFVFSNI